MVGAANLARWGNVASIIGVFLTSIGFIITIWNVVRSRKAAEQAENAAREATRALVRFDTIEALSAAIAILEEIKRLHRVGAWTIVPDRYTSLRTLLSRILTASPESTQRHKTAMMSLIGQLIEMEKSADRALAANTQPKNLAVLNETLSKYGDELGTALVEIRGQHQ